MFKKIIAYILLVSILIFSLGVSVSAETPEVLSLANYLFDKLSGADLIDFIGHAFKACPGCTDGGNHHWDVLGGAISGTFTLGMDFDCCCTKCNMLLSDYIDSENDYLTEEDVLQLMHDKAYDLPAQTVNSDGSFILYPEISNVSFWTNANSSNIQNKPNFNDLSQVSSSWFGRLYSHSFSNNRYYLSFSPYDNQPYFSLGQFILTWSVTTPLSGYYTVQPTVVSRSGVSSDSDYSDTYPNDSVSRHYYNSSSSFSFKTYSSSVSKSWQILSVIIPVPPILFEPSASLDITSGDTYNIDNRISNYVSNYTYNNQTYNQQIINETNNTYYSPITNETYDMSGWSYDYSTRTYNVTYNEGDTVNITYGDENITIVEGGNTYNYYYYITNEAPDDPDNPGTSGILDWLGNFKDWLSGKFNDLIGAVNDVSVDVDASQHTDYDVTIYDEDGEEQQFSISDVKAKFAWLSDVKEIGNTFLTEVQANEQAAYSYNSNGPPLLGASGNPTGAPSIPINLAAAQSHYGYDYGGEVEGLDLSWYAPYKSTVDHLISGFLWLLFLWGLWKNAPNIISGSGILSNRVEDIKSGEKGKKK